MIKVDQYTCGQHVFFNLHNGENENDLKNMLKSYKLSKLSGRIVFFNAYDDTAGKIWPQLCLELTDTEEIYDLIMTTIFSTVDSKNTYAICQYPFLL